MSSGTKKPTSVCGTIALMGLDGTGKSTQVQLLQSHRGMRGEKVVAIHHASAKVPGLALLKQRYHGRAIEMLKRWGAHVDWEGDRKRRSRAGHVVGWAVSVWLLVGSGVKSVWYARRHRRASVILDRCFVDDAVKVRWRFGKKPSLGKWLMRVVPRPDLVVVLEGDPCVTFGRKKSRNCSYREYLEKERILDEILSEAEASGWPIRRIDITHRTIEEVHGALLRILKEQNASA